MEEHEKIELRSEEVQEILGTPPSSVVRWGTTVAFLSVFLMFLVSYIVKYPDKIVAPIVITTSSPPVPLVARSDGYMSKFKVVDKQPIQKGDILVVMESTADYRDILELDDVVKDIQGFSKEELLNLIFPDMLELGQIQSEYSSFRQEFDEYIYGVTSNFEAQNKSQLQRQKTNLQDGIKKDDTKLVHTRKQLASMLKKQKRVQQLYPDNASLNELEEVSSDVLSLKKSLEEIESNKISKRTRISEIDNEMLRIDQGFKKNNNDNFIRFRESMNRLSSRIEDWKQRYLLTAPFDGVTSFHTYWKEQQFVRSGEDVMSIVPVDGDTLIGKVLMPSVGSGKVKIGHDVIIKFDGYPYEEFGSVRGKVHSKSLVPKDNKYRVIVSLPKGLKTSHKKELPFNQQMQGRAEIITEKKRFIEKLFEELLGRFEDYQ